MTNRFFKPLLFIALLGGSLSFAQKPVEVCSYAQVRKPNEFYLQQIELWKKETEKDPSNANAWYNYYKANRYVQMSGKHDSAYSSKRFQRMNRIVNDIQKNIPNTFEAHFIKWANGYNNWSLMPELEKAYAIDPERWETWDGFINFYEVNRNYEKRDAFLQKWYESEKRSPGLLNYNYNVLMSLKPNAILVTAGDNDTYFAWMLQSAMGIRKDVMILNASLTGIKKYSDKLSEELGIRLPETETMSYPDFAMKLIKELVRNRDKRPVYAGLTVNEELIDPVKENLYLVGLVYEYSNEKMDNVAVLKKNMEKLYELDYLKHTFGRDPYETVVAVANTNYIVPMLTLYSHYQLSGDESRADYWKGMAEKLAEGTDNEAEVKAYFKK